MTVVAQSVSLTVMLVAVLAGIFLNNKAAQELKADFRRDIDRLDKKIDGVSQRLDDVSVGLNAKMDGISLQINGRLDVIEADLRQFYQPEWKARRPA